VGLLGIGNLKAVLEPWAGEVNSVMRHASIVCALLLFACRLFAQDAAVTTQSTSGVPADALPKREARTVNFSGFEVINAHGAKDSGLYPDQILTVVRARWNRLIAAPEMAGRKPGMTLVEATVRTDGSLEKIKTVESSGDTSLDEAAQQAVTEPAPFPHFPADFHDKELQLRFHFGYAQPAAGDTPVCGEHPLTAPKLNAPPAGHGPIHPPSLTFSPDPDYGNEARKAKYQSIVVLGGIVDTDGSFHDLCVKQAAGQGLDEKAIEAASRWKFKPADRGGELVAVYIEVEVDFRLY
jgi:TonB family protein